MLPLKFSMAFVVRNFVYNAPAMPKRCSVRVSREALASADWLLCGERTAGIVPPAVDLRERRLVL